MELGKQTPSIVLSSLQKATFILQRIIYFVWREFSGNSWEADVA